MNLKDLANLESWKTHLFYISNEGEIYRLGLMQSIEFDKERHDARVNESQRYKEVTEALGMHPVIYRATDQPILKPFEIKTEINNPYELSLFQNHIVSGGGIKSSFSLLRVSSKGRVENTIITEVFITDVEALMTDKNITFTIKYELEEK